MTRCRLPLSLILLAAAAALSAQAPSSVIASSGSRKAAVSTPQPRKSLSLPLRIVQSAKSYLGVPYVHGGDDRTGLDCSGFTYRVYNDVMGVSLPRGTWGLYNQVRPVSYPLHIGDLLFFDTTGRTKPVQPAHVGIYVGENRFVHAASEGPRTGVIISELSDKYYHGSFLGARRVITWRDPLLVMTLTDSYQSMIQEDPFASREALTVHVVNQMTGGGPMDLRVFKNGKRKLFNRIYPSSQNPTELTLTPDIGEWTVTVSRIWGGRELGRMVFTVLE